jgi:hypothetical protein
MGQEEREHSDNHRIFPAVLQIYRVTPEDEVEQLTGFCLDCGAIELDGNKAERLKPYTPTYENGILFYIEDKSVDEATDQNQDDSATDDSSMLQAAWSPSSQALSPAS